jgi:hypothetical protein
MVSSITNTALQTLTASHTTQISSNDTDITALQGRLDLTEPKLTALETLTASHITQISSNDTDITALQTLIRKPYNSNFF